MSKGQMAKVLCPHYLDKGGSVNNFRQSGVAWIKEGSDLTYEFEVHDCVQQLDFPKDDPIIPRRCVFVTLDGLGRRLALTAATNDKYAPRNTGLYDVILEDWDGKGSDNKLQMWWWDDRDHALHNFGHGDSDAILFEGFNKNLVLYRNLHRDAQKFTYNGSTRFWRNDHTKRAMSVAWAHFRAGESVVTEEVDNNHATSGVNWYLHYCSEEPTNISASAATI